jgi:hypothetical protein
MKNHENPKMAIHPRTGCEDFKLARSSFITCNNIGPLKKLHTPDRYELYQTH